MQNRMIRCFNIFFFFLYSKFQLQDTIKEVAGNFSILKPDILEDIGWVRHGQVRKDITFKDAEVRTCAVYECLVQLSSVSSKSYSNINVKSFSFLHLCSNGRQM